MNDESKALLVFALILLEGAVLAFLVGEIVDMLRRGRRPRITFQAVVPTESAHDDSGALYRQQQTTTAHATIVENDTEDFDLPADFATPVMPMPGAKPEPESEPKPTVKTVLRSYRQ